MNDSISRQAAIDAILAVTGNSSVRELYEHVQEHGLSDMWSGGVNAAIDIIIAVPPAQPEIPPYVAEIEAEYKKWINVPYIGKPLAKALYEVWKRHDRKIQRGEQMTEYVDLSERVTATFYSDEYEEWTQQTVTIADVLDSVCEDYTVLLSAQPEIIHCKDCKFYTPLNRETKSGICSLLIHQNFGDDWYCAGAERRNDEPDKQTD